MNQNSFLCLYPTLIPCLSCPVFPLPVKSENPPVNVVAKFVHLLESNEVDLNEELGEWPGAGHCLGQARLSRCNRSLRRDGLSELPSHFRHGHKDYMLLICLAHLRL